MPVRRKREKAPVVPLPSNLDDADLTDMTYPEGTPKGDDGAVAAAGTPISIDRARKVGALNADAARENKVSSKKIARKAAGETDVPWNETRTLQMFDYARMTYGPQTLVLHITDTETNIVHRPVPMQQFKTSADLYKHLEKLNAGKSERTYEVIFKDATQKSNRATTSITMPDGFAPAVEDAPPMREQHQQPPQNVLPPWPAGLGGYPQQPYGYPQGYPPPQVAPPPQAPPTAAPAPQYQPMPQGLDPVVTQALNDMRSNQDLLMRQVQGALGGLEEFKRMQAQMEAARAALPYGPPPQAPPAQAAPPPSVDPYRPPAPAVGSQRVFLGYDDNGAPLYGRPPAQTSMLGQPGQPAGPWGPPPPPAPVQAAPPPPPPPAVQVQPKTAAQQLSGMASELVGMFQALESIKKVAGAPNGRAAAHAIEPEEEIEETPPPVVPQELFKVLTLGQDGDPDAPVMVHDVDGNIDWSSTAMGNLPKVPALLKKIADAVTKVNDATQTVQRARPITTQGHVVSAPSVPVAPPRAAPQIVAAPPPPPAPPPPRATGPSIPTSIPVRTA